MFRQKLRPFGELRTVMNRKGGHNMKRTFVRFGQPTKWPFTKRVSGHALGILLWLASPAVAQPTYNPLTIDDPTPQATAAFGWAVAEAGDVNGDGTPDLLVGAPRQDVGSNSLQGQAFVLSGVDGSLLLTLDDPTLQAVSPGF